MPALLPPSYPVRHGHAVRVELAHERPLRERNKLYYRILHWPVWIFAFFIAPGPITFSLFAEGPGPATLTWLAVVVAGTGLAALAGRLPGVEARPLILRFTEDRPNPVHRRICYTVAWGDIVSFASLNFIGIVDAIVNGEWRMRAIYDAGYVPIVAGVWLAGAAGWLPRAGRSTKGEGFERRYFYGAVWSVTIAQLVLWWMWAVLPLGGAYDIVKLAVYGFALAALGNMARLGLLPRTRPILPGEVFASD